MDNKASKSIGLFPCMNCTERVLKCHGTCERYIKYAEDLRVKNANIAEQRKQGLERASYVIGIQRKQRKRLGHEK